MTTVIQQSDPAAIVERLVVSGDLAALTPEQRVIYYRQVCESTGLNPFTRPFDYITLNGKLTLYANKGASDQLRASRGISITSVEASERDGVYIVRARAMTQDGRTDESTGAVSIVGLKGDALANAIMKAETKAKRRVTLSIAGLGFLDETEIDTIPAGAVQRTVVQETGEIVRRPTPPPPAQPRSPTSESVIVVAEPFDNPFDDPSVGTGASPVNEKQLKALHALGNEAYGKGWDDKRHDLVFAASGKRTRSSKELTHDEASRLIDGLRRKLETVPSLAEVPEVAH